MSIKKLTKISYNIKNWETFGILSFPVSFWVIFVIPKKSKILYKYLLVGPFGLIQFIKLVCRLNESQGDFGAPGCTLGLKSTEKWDYSLSKPLKNPKQQKVFFVSLKTSSERGTY